jgi:NitT/TauT family transport system permease protein
MDFLFKLRGTLTKTQEWILGVLGVVLLLVFWAVIANLKSEQKPEYKRVTPESVVGMSKTTIDSLERIDEISRKNATEFETIYPILPPPNKVLTAFGGLFKNDNIGFHTKRSVWLNLQGYFWAILIALPIGLVIGLFPLFRGLFSKQVDATRFLPLTALTGLFITWYGTGDKMKVAFLAVGIIVYLLPVVVQRVDEVADIHLKMAFTLSANAWQTIRTVYLPSVFSKITDDIRVLTAISWTYIIIAELLNQKGGLGALIYLKARQGHLDKVFAILIIIIIIGVLQDRIFLYLDKMISPHKYFKVKSGAVKRGIETMRYGALAFIIGLVLFLSSAVDPVIGLGLLAIGIGFIVYGEIIVDKKVKEEA